MKRISLFFTLFYSFLLFSALIMSCSQEDVQLNQFSDSKTETRSQTSCDPQGICNDPEPRSWNFNYLGCSIRVYMTVTECTDGSGNKTIYFQEQQQIVDIISGSCTVDLDFIEGAYRAAVEFHMQLYKDDMPLCGSTGDPVVSSKQIKVNCQKYCYIPVFEVGEDPSYEWLNCSNQESCCIVTIEWCVDGEGNEEGTLVSEEEVGSCSGGQEDCPFSNVASPYSPGSSNPECIVERCE